MEETNTTDTTIQPDQLSVGAASVDATTTADGSATTPLSPPADDLGLAAPLTNTSKTFEQIQAELAKERGEKAKIGWQKILRTYVVPLLALLIFFGVLVLAIIPAVNQIFAKLDELSSYAQQVDDANTLITQLQQVAASSQQLNSDLSSLNEIIPTGVTQVVSYQQKVRQLAEQNGLTVTEAITSEQQLRVDDEDAQQTVLGTIEIPTTFTVRGSFTGVQSFIEDIKNIEDFVIIGEMELKSSGEVTASTINNLSNLQWTLIITFVKYQFQPIKSTEEVETIYQNVPPSTSPDEDILEFIRSKLS